MSYIKAKEEVALITQGGKLMGEILEKLAAMVRPGISAWEIDCEAERLILEAGGRPAFKGYKPHGVGTIFPSTICACVNDELVHGFATKEKILKDGDIFSIDIGMEWPYRSHKSEVISQKSHRGYFTDTALTIAVGKIPEKTQQLINVTRKALEMGIEQCRPGNTIADIGRAIQTYVEPQGYGIVRDLVGHGVGHAVHEDPPVPNYYSRDLENWKLEPGVVIAIEPMITMGDYHVKTDDDEWTIRTEDGSLCAHFEHTIVITNSDPLVVTRRPSE